MRRRRMRRDSADVLALIALFLVTLTTFLQNVVDYLQSKSVGAYQPTWQRILIAVILFLSLIGFLIAYMANSRSRKNPIP